MILDLHTHSNASDGIYTPEEVVQIAHDNGVEVFALTDHDTVAGVRKAGTACLKAGIRFVPGCELSCTWHKKTVHVVALGIQDFSFINARAEVMSAVREKRARLIAQKLESLGIEGTYEEAVSAAKSTLNLSRRHFAMALVRRGAVSTEDEAFEKFLGDGGPAYVETQWDDLPGIQRLISQSGAVAVMAHPGRYHFDFPYSTDGLLKEFKALGGRAIEVTTGSHTRDDNRKYAKVAKKMGFYASTGSDFHGGRPGRPGPGMQAPLPEGLSCVLELLGN